MAPRNKINLVGKVFTRLTVLEESGRSNSGHVLWRCLCECGKEVITTTSNLLKNQVKSCGCYSRDSARERLKRGEIKTGWDTVCKYCGKPFKTLSVKQVYCCDECSFLDRLELKPGGCVEWKGNRNNQGYGVLRASINGNPRKMVQAHRYAWYRVNGDIPSDKCLCHTCDNPCCVNIEHLFLGTWADNNKDRSIKGRSGKREYSQEERNRYSEMFRGEKNKYSKLTEDEVRVIKSLRGTKTAREIGEMFGVTKGAVQSIFGGYTWKHVE